MPRSDYVRCRNCDRPAVEVGTLSCTRLCSECSDAIMSENVLGLASMTNPARDRWRRGMAASVGAQLLDDQPRGSETGEHA